MSTIQTNRSGLKVWSMSRRKCKYSEIRSLHKYNANKKITLIEKVLLLRGDVPRRCNLRLSIFFRKPLPNQYQNMWLKFDPVGDANARVQRKDLPWCLIFHTTPYLSTILANMSGCAVFYSNVAISRQRVLITDHFCTQIPTRAISQCLGFSWCTNCTCGLWIA